MSKLTKFNKLTGVAAAALASAIFCATASASIHYNFTAAANSLSSGADVTGATFSSKPSGSDSGPDVTVTGWSNYNTQGGSLSGSNRLIDNTAVKTWSGLGVEYPGEGGSPQHSTDNSGPEDMILFSFASDIELNGLSIGWKGSDSDMTILAYTGGDPFNSSTKLDGLRYNQLVGEGWQVIDHVSNVTVDPSPSTTGNFLTSFNSGGISSSYWLIGAYNPFVGNDQGWSKGNDYIKLSALTGKKTNGVPPTGVPEPSTILLLALGLLAIWHYRRRDSGIRPGHSLAC